jgi:tRNA(fMet)-specific endonuclease VapC
MNLFLLDTDIISFVLADDLFVNQRLAISGTNTATSIVTVHEVFNGWASRINSAKTTKELVFLYEKLAKALVLFKKVRILDFDDRASEQLKILLQNNPELNKKKLQKDMRIAAIALGNNAIVVTRNHRDFSQVPGLNIVDWTQ